MQVGQWSVGATSRWRPYYFHLASPALTRRGGIPLVLLCANPYFCHHIEIAWLRRVVEGDRQALSGVEVVHADDEPVAAPRGDWGGP